MVRAADGEAGENRLSPLLVCYLAGYAVVGYLLLFPRFADVSTTRLPETALFTLAIWAVFLPPFSLDSSRSRFTFLHPFLALGVLVLGAASVIPCAVAFAARRSRRGELVLARIWDPVRLVPILLIANAVYEMLGGERFHDFTRVAWGPFLCVVVTIGLLDLFSMKSYHLLLPGARASTRTVYHSEFIGLLLSPIAIPLFVLYQQQGVPALAVALLPVFGLILVVRRLLSGGAERDELVGLLLLAQELVDSKQDLDRMGDTVSQRIRGLFLADGVDLFRLEAGSWTLQSSSGETPWQGRDPAPQSVELFEVSLTARGKPIIYHDSHRDPGLDPYRARGLRSFLLVPLFGGNDLIGCLLCSKAHPPHFREEDRELARIVMGQVSSAIMGARLHGRLAATLEQLRKTTELKGKFLSTISHELRTPLSAITSFAEILLRGLGDPALAPQRRDAEKILDWSGRLMRLINELQELSRIEAGKLRLQKVPFAVNAIVMQSVASLESLAQRKGLALSADLPTDTVLANGDPDRVLQILVNIIGNAIKFTDRGSVTIGVLPGPAHVSVKIADTGEGIPAEELPSIFDEFHQAATGQSRKREGSGLGLAIARRLVELQGGTIWAESAPGKGSCFTFTLPTSIRPPTRSG